MVTIFGNVVIFCLISCFVATQFCFGRKYFVGQKRKRNVCIFWSVALWIFSNYPSFAYLVNLILYLKCLQWFEKDFGASDIICEKSHFQIAEAWITTYWNDWWKPKKPSNNNTYPQRWSKWTILSKTNYYTLLRYFTYITQNNYVVISI